MLLFVVGLALACDVTLLVNVAPHDAQLLVNRGNVIGVYEDLVLLCDAGGGKRLPSSNLVVIELAAGNDTAGWAKQVHDAVSRGGGAIEFAHSKSRFILSVSSNDLLGRLPVNTQLLPVSTTNFLQPASSVALPTIAAEPDPRIAELTAKVSAATLRGFLDYLTGVTSSITTRNSYSAGGLAAAAWLQERFVEYGFEVEMHWFRSDMGPNVIATRRGRAGNNRVVVVGGHYDSRGTDVNSPTQLAPGANDDASGTVILLQIAKIIFDENVQLEDTIVLGAWGGEEQGLVGSRSYAVRCRAENMNIVAMYQADMVAFRPTNAPVQLGFATRYTTPELTQFCKDTAALYQPGIASCDTTSCCSDQQSFFEQGYPAVFYFGRCGPSGDNMYHQSGDVVQRPGFDVEGELATQARAFMSVTLVTAKLAA